MFFEKSHRLRQLRRRRCALEELEPRSLLAAQSLIGLDLLRADPRFAGIDGRGYTAVVLDYGADLDHAAFGPDANGNGVADRIIYQEDFADGDNDASDGSFGSHGTHVTSIIGSQDATFPGVAPGANLIVLKVFENDQPTGQNPGVDIIVLEQALNWIEAHVGIYNIVTVNLSIQDGNYTTPFLSSRVHDEFQRLTDAGVICVASSGNEYRTFGPGVAYPAADPFVLAVGSVWDDNYGARTVEDATDNTTAADRVSGYSQRHITMTDVLAPGGVIVGAKDGGGFMNKSGTSMAAPFISGAVLLAQQLAKREMGRFLTYDEFRTLIRDTAVTVNDGDDENFNVTPTGADYPRVNIFAMAEALLNNPGPPSISVTDVSISEGDTGAKIVEITVQLTRASTAPVTVQYATANGTATLGDNDYLAANGTVTFDAGETSQRLQFTINGDKGVEANETFVVNFSNPIGAVVADSQAVITITNDDFIRLWQNPALAMDVNDSGTITGLDALIIINRLNTVGAGVLPSQPPPGRYFYFDVNGDNACTPLDALIIIHELNQRAQQGDGGMAAAASGEGASVELNDGEFLADGGDRLAVVTGKVETADDGSPKLAVLADEVQQRTVAAVVRSKAVGRVTAGKDDSVDLIGLTPSAGTWAFASTDLLATSAIARVDADFWAEFE
jgi:hypothetical protein